MKFYITIFLTFLFYSSIAQVKVIKFPELESYIAKKGKKCKSYKLLGYMVRPCIKELPYFDSISHSYDTDEVEVLLVSLDFLEQKERVEKFLTKKNIVSSVWLLDETDANSYIDKVDPSWSGAIPATLLIQSSTGHRIFLEKELTKEELETHVKKLLN